LSLAAVRDLRDARSPAGPDELAAFETDVLAGFVLARAAAGLADAHEVVAASQRVTVPPMLTINDAAYSWRVARNSTRTL
jgi:hypothetical protein